MSKFVQFFAEGVIHDRDKNGQVSGVKGYRFGSGVTLDSAELMGKVFSQCPNLLPCDCVTVETSPIG